MRLKHYGPRKKIPQAMADDRAVFTDLLWSWGVRMAAVETQHTATRDSDGFLYAVLRQCPEPAWADDVADADAGGSRFGWPLLGRDGRAGLRELIPEHWLVAAGVG